MADEIKKPKVLLVEDDVFMLDLLVRELTNAGLEVSVAKTGIEGVKKFEEYAPDLIILDILLPDQGGLDMLREIRKKPRGPETKVIVLSNLGEEREVAEARRLGVVDYLVKANFSLPEIIEKVNTALGRS